MTQGNSEVIDDFLAVIPGDFLDVLMRLDEYLDKMTIPPKIRISGHTIPCNHCHKKNARIFYKPGYKPLCVDCFVEAVISGFFEAAILRMIYESLPTLGGPTDECCSRD